MQWSPARGDSSTQEYGASIPIAAFSPAKNYSMQFAHARICPFSGGKAQTFASGELTEARWLLTNFLISPGILPTNGISSADPIH